MKKLIFTSLLFLSTIRLFAQSYTPFVDTNSVWRDRRQLICSNGGGFAWNINLDGQEYIKGDTVMGYTYGKVYFTGYKITFNGHNGSLNWDSLFICELYLGGIREDSLKKVFFKDTTGTEIELFNFNINTGDSVEVLFGINPPYSPSQLIVDHSDSVFVYNKYRKRYFLSTFYNPSQTYFPLIEGIGMKFGLLGHLSSNVCASGELLSYYFHNTPAYVLNSNNYLFNCPTIITEDTTSVDFEFQIFPNPFISELTITVPNNNNQPVPFSIKDICGRQVNTNAGNEIISGVANTLNLAHLSQGIYILELNIEDRRIIKKIIKQ